MASEQSTPAETALDTRKRLEGLLLEGLKGEETELTPREWAAIRAEARNDYQRLRRLNAQQLQEFCERISERAAERGLTAEKLATLLADEG